MPGRAEKTRRAKSDFWSFCAAMLFCWTGKLIDIVNYLTLSTRLPNLGFTRDFWGITSALGTHPAGCFAILLTKTSTTQFGDWMSSLVTNYRSSYASILIIHFWGKRICYHYQPQNDTRIFLFSQFFFQKTPNAVIMELFAIFIGKCASIFSIIELCCLIIYKYYLLQFMFLFVMCSCTNIILGNIVINNVTSYVYMCWTWRHTSTWS